MASHVRKKSGRRYKTHNQLLSLDAYAAVTDVILVAAVILQVQKNYASALARVAANITCTNIILFTAARLICILRLASFKSLSVNSALLKLHKVRLRIQCLSCHLNNRKRRIMLSDSLKTQNLSKKFNKNKYYNGISVLKLSQTNPNSL